MTSPGKRPPPKGKRGPKPETLKVEGDWQEAVAKALARGKPPVAKPKKKRKRK